MSNYINKKKDMKFPNNDSLNPVRSVIEEANAALNDKSRTVKNSPMGEVLSGAVGAGIGGATSFAALFALGTAGLSAAGITSGLAAAGAVVGGGMAAGVMVLAAPVALCAAAGVGIATHIKNEKLKEEKDSLFRTVVEKQNCIIKELNHTNSDNVDRINELTGLNILLRQAIIDLGHDVGISGSAMIAE